MRPIRRRASPLPHDFDDYRDAFTFLFSRLGGYCSYCERKIVTQLAVEHIQPKALAKYAHLIGRWDNFLLGCVNCNSTKGDRDVNPEEVLLPDRDNTFHAFTYEMDGSLHPAASSAAVQAMAANTLALVGLDKRASQVWDENGKLVAIDRMSQRMEAWLQALEAKSDIESNPGNTAVRRSVVRLAEAKGFFSIWMAVFVGDIDMRNRLIDAFAGTRESNCFDAVTTEPISPSPNLDALPHGGKI